MGSKIPKENMIPLGQPGREKEDAKVRAKLKNSGSKKRLLAQQVRRAQEKMKSGNISNDKILELISSPDASARQIQTMIQAASKMDLKPMEFINLINTAIRKHGAIFGSKVDISAKMEIKNTTLFDRVGKHFIKEKRILQMAIEKTTKDLYGEDKSQEVLETIRQNVFELQQQAIEDGSYYDNENEMYYDETGQVRIRKRKKNLIEVVI